MDAINPDDPQDVSRKLRQIADAIDSGAVTFKSASHLIAPSDATERFGVLIQHPRPRHLRVVR